MEREESMIICKTLDELRFAIDSGKAFIWDGPSPLYEVLEDVCRGMNNQAKFKVRGCYNLRLSEDIIIKKKDNKEIIAKANNIADLRDKLDEIDIDNIIVLTSNDDKELHQVYQQLIYLEKICKVFLEEELDKKLKINKFLENRENFINLIMNLKDALNEKIDICYNISNKEDREKALKIFNELINTLEQIIELTTKFEIKPLKVGVFATKKAGKSMIVNCLLKEEYAPTSIELPTPCNIFYKPHDRAEIILHHEGEEKIFNRPEELREYLNKMFRQVSLEGKRLSDMTIYYPAGKDIIKYEIIDTPGPDLAGSEHFQAVQHSLAEADVVVFVIDYSKYAQESEVELIRKIKEEIIDKSQKINSLIVVINKLDLVFLDANTEKLKLRITDFIYKKFKEKLGIEHLIVLPMSALTGFYLTKLRKLYGEEIKDAKEIKEKLEEKYEEFKKSKNYNEDIATYISEVQNIANSIEKWFKKNMIGYQDLWTLSGIDFFESFLVNVVLEKALLDKHWNILTQIEAKLTFFKNIINQNIQSFKVTNEKLEDIKFAFESLKNEIDKLSNNLIKEFNLNLNRELVSIKDLIGKLTLQCDMVKRVIDYIRNSLKDKYNKLKLDVERVAKGELSIDDFNRRLKDKYYTVEDYIMSEFEGEIENLKKIQINLERINKNLIQIQGAISKQYESFLKECKDKIENFIEELEKKYGIVLNLVLPSLPIRITFKEFISELNKIEFKIEMKTLEIKNIDDFFEGGIIRWLMHKLFGSEKYKVKDELKIILDNWYETNLSEVESNVPDLISLTMIKSKLEFSYSLFEREAAEITKIVNDHIESLQKSISYLVLLLELDIDNFQKLLMLFESINQDYNNSINEVWKAIMESSQDDKSKQEGL